LTNERTQTAAVNGSKSETSLTWIGRLAAGPAPADADWQKLVDIYAPLVAHWSDRAGVARSDRDDLVQDVLFVVVRRVNDFQRRHEGAFRGWLRAIFTNHLKKYFRDHAKHTSHFNLDEACDPHSALSHFFDLEHEQHIAHQAMRIVRNDFSEITWTAFHQQVVDGSNAQQVASDLQLSLNAVLKAKSRVLKRIRQELLCLTC